VDDRTGLGLKGKMLGVALYGVTFFLGPSLIPSWFITSSERPVAFAGSRAEENLRAYRHKLFGKFPLLNDGLLEKIDYGYYEKDKTECHAAILGGIKFLKGENRELYGAVHGEVNGRGIWQSDRKKAVLYLLNGINIPDYFIHRSLREQLHRDGIMNFEWHKNNFELKFAHLTVRYGELAGNPDRTLIESAEMGLIEKAFSYVPDAVDGMQALFLLTVPFYDERAYKGIEKQRQEVIAEAFKALDNARNLGDGLDSGDYTKIGHQSKELFFRFDGMLSDLLEMQDAAVQDARHVVSLGRTEKLIYPSSGEAVAVYDYVAEEWDALRFSEWKSSLEERIELWGVE
jgi:hypothetical protein